MPKPKIPRLVVDQVRALWGEDPNQSARSVFRRYIQRYGEGQVGLRKVQDIISLVKRQAPERPFPFREWKAWHDTNETPEDAAYLLQLDAASNVIYGRHLYEHEAGWGRRLRVALQGVVPGGQLIVVREYGNRERLGFFFSEPPYTADLDALVSFKPWLPDNYERYHAAVYFGLVPALSGWALREFLSDPEAYWKMAQGTEDDQRLPNLNRLGYSSAPGYLTGFDFEHPRPPSAVEGESNPPQRLRAWLAELWASRLPETEADDQVVN